MLKTRLFRRYFSMYCTLVIISILILGVVLLGFAAGFFERAKYDSMEKYLSQAVSITVENYEKNNKAYVEKSLISMAYSVVSRVIVGEVYLTDAQGSIVYYSNVGLEENKRLNLSGDAVPASIAQQVIDAGHYEETGNMLGFYDQPRYTVGLPLYADDQVFGVVFASCPADDLMNFLTELLKMFVLSAVVVLALASIVIYFVTARMVQPLRIMLDATQSFAKGDFTKRVPVSGYDEIGQLSMAFNNMASTLAITETTRRSFVANVSHELKTPMTTISGFVDGILDGTIPMEKRDQYLTVVSNECKRLTRLVRSMLDTSRIEAGEMQIKPAVFDISETIRQTVFSFEQAIEEKQLEIMGLETDKIMVLADKDLLHQVIYNLIDNAVKFVEPSGYLSFSYRIDGKMTYVAIRNSGKGIDKEELPLLFERFYKSDKSRSLNTNGVGLGLHIVRSIINYHKGEIVVRSIPGEYTEFEFSVPNPP
ncbi:MAG: HAMP domain-containing histidine kinase [Oscillospiraceae bacterium]|jgi:signal transduction histidine kinase|nr:HAMP domain-containing histidine kinase [Oscillospiraceae bacterium]